MSREFCFRQQLFLFDDWLMGQNIAVLGHAATTDTDFFSQYNGILAFSAFELQFELKTKDNKRS